MEAWIKELVVSGKGRSGDWGYTLGVTLRGLANGFIVGVRGENFQEWLLSFWLDGLGGY